MNSLTTSENGSRSAADFYKMLWKLGMVRGTPNYMYLLRFPFATYSSSSAVVSDTSYINKGHMSVGRMPCWHIHNFYFHSSPDLLILLSQSFSCVLILLTLLMSFRESSNHLPRHLTWLLSRTVLPLLVQPGGTSLSICLS